MTKIISLLSLAIVISFAGSAIAATPSKDHKATTTTATEAAAPVAEEVATPSSEEAAIEKAAK